MSPTLKAALRYLLLRRPAEIEEVLRRRLNHLCTQAALYGTAVPPHVLMEIEDILDIRAAEPVDRLRVVADYSQISVL